MGGYAKTHVSGSEFWGESKNHVSTLLMLPEFSLFNLLLCYFDNIKTIFLIIFKSSYITHQTGSELLGESENHVSTPLMLPKFN